VTCIRSTRADEGPKIISAFSGVTASRLHVFGILAGIVNSEGRADFCALLQLCLALAALAAHTPASEWDEGHAVGPAGSGIVGWLQRQLGTQPDAVPALLEVLTVLVQVCCPLCVLRHGPCLTGTFSRARVLSFHVLLCLGHRSTQKPPFPREGCSTVSPWVVPAWLVQEVGAHKLAVKPERRRQFSGELVSAAPQVFSMLASCHACAPSDANLTNAVWRPSRASSCVCLLALWKNGSQGHGLLHPWPAHGQPTLSYCLWHLL